MTPRRHRSTIHRLADLSHTPNGLSEEMLLARYRAAKLLADVHCLPVSSFLADWKPSDISHFEEMATASGEGEGESEYPFALGYTNGKGEAVRRVVHDSDEADEAFDEMFKSSPLGEAIPYSVDSVD